MTSPQEISKSHSTLQERMQESLFVKPVEQSNDASNVSPTFRTETQGPKWPANNSCTGRSVAFNDNYEHNMLENSHQLQEYSPSSYPPSDPRFVLKDILTPIEMEARIRHQNRMTHNEEMKAKKIRENIWF
jgi:hypothetical protein